MAFRAKLDFDQVYWGVEEVAQLAAGDVQVPADCDLRVGAYRWDAKNARFEPLPPSQVKKAEGAPSLEQAFAALVDHVKQIDTAGTVDLPASVQAWREHYNTTLDGAK